MWGPQDPGQLCSELMNYFSRSDGCIGKFVTRTDKRMLAGGMFSGSAIGEPVHDLRLLVCKPPFVKDECTVMNNAFPFNNGDQLKMLLQRLEYSADNIGSDCHDDVPYSSNTLSP